MRKFIPTPSSSTLELGFFSVHFYALAILLGIVFAIWLTKRRYAEAGGNPIKKKVAEVAATKIRKTATEKALRIEQEASQKADEIMSKVK